MDAMTTEARRDEINGFLGMNMAHASRRAARLSSDTARAEEIVSDANLALWTGEITQAQYLPRIEREASAWRGKKHDTLLEMAGLMSHSFA